MPNILGNIRLSIVTFISRLISGSIVYIVLARSLDLNDFGLLSFGATLAGLITVIAEFGFSLMAQRDIPQNRYNFELYVFNTFIQKIGFALIALSGGLIYLLLFYSKQNLTIGVIFVVNAIITSGNMYFFAVFRAKNKFIIESWLSAFYTIVLIILIILFFALKFDVIIIAYGLLIARLLQFVLLIIIFISKYKLKWSINKEIQRYLFRNSFSFGLHYIIGIFYFSIDNQLLAYYSGNEAIAIYQSIFKIVMILLSLSALFEGVFLPFLSAKFVDPSGNFLGKAVLINKIILGLGLSIFIFFSLFAKDLITLFYTEKYLASLSIVLPLGLMLLTRVATTVYSLFLTISNHQNIRVIIVSISLVVNVALNFIFIPKYGYIGAAYVSFATHIVLSILYILFAYKYLKTLLLSIDIIIFGVLTIALVVVLNIMEIQPTFIYSSIIMIVWLILLISLFNRKQLFEIKNLVTSSYL